MEDENDFLDAPEHYPNEDELHIGLKILSFCIPIAGAIVYFSISDRYQNKKQQACYAALLGVGFNLLLRIFFTMMGI